MVLLTAMMNPKLLSCRVSNSGGLILLKILKQLFLSFPVMVNVLSPYSAAALLTMSPMVSRLRIFPISLSPF
jgi:hypothetical protein